MTRWFCTGMLAAALLAGTPACKSKTQPKGEEMTRTEEPEATPEPERPQSQFAAWERIEKQLGKFEQHRLEWSRAPLTDGHRAMLKELIAAADLMDEMFFRQVSRRNVQLRTDLEKTDDPGKETISRYFRIMYGPYDRLDHNRPFINVPRKLKGATYYPANMDKAEFEKWIEDHPEDEEAFRAPFTVLTRTKEKRLS